MDAQRLQAYLDDLARLSARHGLAIESTPRGARLVPAGDRMGGYVATPTPRPDCYDIDCYRAGTDRDRDGEIVSEDMSPAAREARAAAWREENSEAIEAQQARHEDLLRATRDLVDEGFRQIKAGAPGIAPEHVRAWLLADEDLPLAVGAIEQACRQHGIELRATPDGVAIVAARDGWEGYDWREADGAVVLVDRDIRHRIAAAVERDRDSDRDDRDAD